MSSGGASEIGIARYSERDRQRWDDFVEQSQQGTLFHTRAFLAYHPPARFTDASLLFFKKGNLIAVLPAEAGVVEGQKVLRSHPGASFAGLATMPLALRDATHLVDALQQFCRREGYAAIELNPPPACYFSCADNVLEFACYRAGFRYARRECTQAVCLPDNPSGVTERFHPEFQRKIRRAQRLGVRVQETDDLAGFYEILSDNLARKHAATPVHTLAELLDLRERLPGRIRLLAGYVAGRMIAGYLLFVCNRRVALAFYISLLYEYQHFRAINLLAQEAMLRCGREGLAYFDFGSSTISGEPNWGLVDFRESAGACGFWRDRLRVDL